MGTYSGNQIFNSFANLRAMSVITAGLYAGPLVGTGAGFIAAFHRILIVGRLKMDIKWLEKKL